MKVLGVPAQRLNDSESSRPRVLAQGRALDVVWDPALPCKRPGSHSLMTSIACTARCLGNSPERYRQ